jgi:hypothetical protein
MSNKIIIVPQGDNTRKAVVNANSPRVVVELKGKPIGQKEIDLAFVIDTTGSMSDKIEGLLQTCSRFIDEFSGMNLEHRVSIVSFGDLTVPGDKIYATEFMADVEKIKSHLREIPRNGGGGNEGETSLEALIKAMSLEFRQQTVKVLILITDEPAIQREVTANFVIRELKRKEFLTFVVSPPFEYFKEMANQNGGKWYQISADTDFTDLLEMFKNIASKVSQVVSDVYKLGNGSVSSYLQLKPPEK